MNDNQSKDMKQLYLKYKNKYLQKKLSMMTGGLNNELILFKADWCGHCKQFAPVWEQINNESKLNCSFKTFDSLDKTEIREYNITGYPTIILKTGDKNIEYVGSRDKKSIEEFVMNYTK
jgi:thiol-disulfide isomerase/thioredoxin